MPVVDTPEQPRSARQDSEGLPKESKTTSVSTQLVGLLAGEVDPVLARRGLSLLRLHARGRWGWFVVFAAATAVGEACVLLIPAASGRALDEAIHQRAGTGLWLLIGALGVSVLASAVTTPTLIRFGSTVTLSVRRAMIDRALRLGMPGRRPFADGALLNRASGDVGGPADYAGMFASVATNGLVAVGAVVGLGMIHWAFPIAFLVGVVVVVAAGSGVLARLTRGAAEELEHADVLLGRFVDALAGRRTIRACGTLHRELERVTQPLPAIVAASKRLLITLAQAVSGLLLASFGLLVCMLGIGLYLFGHGSVRPGGLLAAVQYAQLAFGRARAILDDGWFNLAANRVRSGRVVQVLESPLATPPPASPAPLDPGPGALELRAVRVVGSPDDVLSGCNLRIKAGTTVAVVGRSGVGKSTLAGLVGRLLDPDEGVVLLDGQDLRTIDPAELADTLAYAFERPSLLGVTVRDTITLGTTSTDEQVIEAAKTAAADEFIAHLEAGYRTPLERAPLSGGERQRLGLARAALRRARVLVLDDALSSLDTATEARVFASFRALSKGRTTLVVAHRASTAARADLVAWLVNGRVHRLAPHVELWDDPDYRSAFGAEPT